MPLPTDWMTSRVIVNFRVLSPIGTILACRKYICKPYSISVALTSRIGHLNCMFARVLTFIGGAVLIVWAGASLLPLIADSAEIPIGCAILGGLMIWASL